MPPRTIPCTIHGKTLQCFLLVNAYTEPTDPFRLKVTLQIPETAPEYSALTPSSPVLSINLPNLPNPGPRQFFFKAWDENHGLMESLLQAVAMNLDAIEDLTLRQAGALRVVDEAGIPVSQSGTKAYQVELLWPDSDMEVSIPSQEELQRGNEDWGRFFSNTCTMHLGL